MSPSCKCCVLLIALFARAALAADVPLIQKWEFRTPADASTWGELHEVSDLHIEHDALQLRMTGVDAYLASPAVHLPLDGVVVRVRMRSDRNGDTQVYWRTADMPAFDQLAALNELTEASPAGDFRTIEFKIGKTEDAGKTLAQIRVDPFNGNQDGNVEIASIEILRLPPVIDARLAFRSVNVDVTRPVETVLSLRQLDGSGVRQPVQVIFLNSEGFHAPRGLAPTSQPVELGAMSWPTPGVHVVAATIRSSEAKLHQELAAPVIVGRGDRLPLIPALRSESVRLDFVPMSNDKSRMGAARWQVRDAAGDWRQCGWLAPLSATLDQTSLGDKQHLHDFELRVRDERSVDLITEDESRAIRVSFRVETHNERESIRVDSLFTAKMQQSLLNFTGPSLRCSRERQSDPLDRYAIFGGIEFLEPGWTSSSERSIGRWLADRWTPAGYKISLPVMAIEQDGVTSALMWDPAQTWNKDQTIPAATFASPNFLDGQSSHLTELSAPGIGTLRHENSSYAQTPITLNAGDTIHLSYQLYAEAELPVAMISRRYYEITTPPLPPPAPHDDRQTYDLIARNYGETMYQAGKGWTMHWFTGENARPIPSMAGELVAHSVQTGEKRWVDATGVSGRDIIETSGSLVNRFGLEGAAIHAANTMRPDGTWAFRNTDEMRRRAREFTRDAYDSLGEDGSTSLGTCVQSALPLLGYVLFTGDQKYWPEAEKALEAMRQFRVPRGAQVWEVHQEIPDIRAAALATEAYQIAYEITDDPAYLNDAYYWAWSGVPFVYSWHAPLEDQRAGKLMSSPDPTKSTVELIPFDRCYENPHRQITPYATIPVLGPTFYVANWFGVPVQWCGLEWAWKVLELQRDRPDPLLKAIADGVIASGLQQMFDKAPWVGLYPDSWLLDANTARNPLLSATLPLACLQAQQRVPLWTHQWTRVVRSVIAKQVWHVSGWGPTPELETPLAQPTQWSVNLRYPPGQMNELIIAAADKPHFVKAADALVSPLDSAPPDLREGWYYDETHRILVIRFRQINPTTHIAIEW